MLNIFSSPTKLILKNEYYKKKVVYNGKSI